MGTVFKKTATKALPAGAKIILRKGQRFAEWIDAKEKGRTGEGEDTQNKREQKGSEQKQTIYPMVGVCDAEARLLAARLTRML